MLNYDPVTRRVTIDPITTIAPFTRRNGETYQTILERLVRFVNEVIDKTNDSNVEVIDAVNAAISESINAVNEALEAQTIDNDTKMSDLIDFVNTEVANLTNYVNGEVGDIVDMRDEMETFRDQAETFRDQAETFAAGTVALQDEAVSALIDNETSLTSSALVRGVVSSRERLEVWVTDHGAQGVAGVDDTAPINAAMAVAVSRRATLVFPESDDGYYTTETLYLPPNLNVDMRAPIIYGGTGAAIHANNTETSSGSTLKLQAYRETLSTWLDESDVGIVLQNQGRNSVIEIVQVARFTVGVLYKAVNSGFVGANITIRSITNCRIGIDTDATGSGWVNDNITIGGYISSTSGVHPSLDRIGIRLRASNDYMHNANLFLKQIIEQGRTTLPEVEVVAIDVTHGNYNAFDDIRSEGNTISIKVSGLSRDNRASFTYDNRRTVLDISERNSTSVSYGIDRTRTISNRLVYMSETLGRAVFPNTPERMMVRGMMVTTGGSENVLADISEITTDGDYLVSPNRQVGIFIDTSSVKRFMVTKNAKTPESGGRVAVRCFGVDGIIDPAANPNTVTGLSPSTGKSFRAGTDSSTPTFFTVDDSVEYISLWIGGVSNTMQLKNFRVDTPDYGATSTWSLFPAGESSFTATAKPTTLGYPIGTHVRNSAPAIGAASGWVYTAEGWLSTGILA